MSRDEVTDTVGDTVMTTASRVFIAVICAIACVGFVGWYDAVVLRAALADSQDLTLLTAGQAVLVCIGATGVALAAIGVFAIARVLSCRQVGVAYLLVGVLLGWLPVLNAVFATWTDERGPILPWALASAIGTLRAAASGPMAAVTIVGCAVFIAGFATLLRPSSDDAGTEDNGPRRPDPTLADDPHGAGR